MPVMTSQILKFVDFTKTQKSRYLENETFFLQIKKFINYTSSATLLRKIVFLAEVTFNVLLKAFSCFCRFSTFIPIGEMI